MTPAQRRAINRMNALKSTGPKTAEGKERTRRNALKHGLCAAQLVLATENADELQNEFNEWIEHYQPVGPAEFALVEEIALNQLKLRRCARREAAVVELQVRAADRTWLHEQEDRVSALTELLAIDPVRAVRDLLRFGAGRRYLNERWERLGRWFLRDGYCQVPALVEEAVRLLGADPRRLKAGSVVGYQFSLCCAGARPTPEPGAIERLLSDAVIHPEYLAEFGRAVPPADLCRGEVRAIVTDQIELLAQIDALEREDGDGVSDEEAELASACERAQLPADGPETKHALRYESQARSALHKALKELDRLQDQRFAVEAAAEAVPAVAPNEADTPPESPPSAEPVSTCDASEDTNPDVPKSGGMPTSSWACPTVADMPTKTWACHPPAVPVVTLEGAEAPPA